MAERILPSGVSNPPAVLADVSNIRVTEDVPLRQPDAPAPMDGGAPRVIAAGSSTGAFGVDSRAIANRLAAPDGDVEAQHARVQEDIQHSVRGDYGRGLEVMTGYFLNGDLEAAPNVVGYDDAWYVLNEIGVCMVGLGRLEEGIKAYDRARLLSIAAEDPSGQRSIAANLAELYGWLGRFGDMRREACEFLRLAKVTDEPRQTKEALVVLAFAQLRDKPERLDDARATLECAAQSPGGLRDLRDLWGIWAGDVLVALGRHDEAEAIATAVLNEAEAKEVGPAIVQADRLLGQIARSRGDEQRSSEHFERALEKARKIGGPIYTETLNAAATRGDSVTMR